MVVLVPSLEEALWVESLSDKLLSEESNDLMNNLLVRVELLV